MKEEVDHILRPSLPWRSGALITECGYDSTKVSTITREEYHSRLNEMGRQRCALFTCMDCTQIAWNYGTWEDDPREAVSREIAFEGRGWEDRGVRMRDELLAIADLIAAHREEFDASLAAIEGRREWNAKKAAMGKRSGRFSELVRD